MESPVWITDMTYISPSGQLIAACTNYCEVRIHDKRIPDLRPALNITYGPRAFKTISYFNSEK